MSITNCRDEIMVSVSKNRSNKMLFSFSNFYESLTPNPNPNPVPEKSRTIWNCCGEIGLQVPITKFSSACTPWPIYVHASTLLLVPAANPFSFQTLLVPVSSKPNRPCRSSPLCVDSFNSISRGSSLDLCLERLLS